MYRATHTLPFILAVFSFSVLLNTATAIGQTERGNWSVSREHNQQAIRLIGENNFADAISRLEKAIQLDPAYADAHMNIGTAYFLLGQPQTALVHLQRGIELDPVHEGYNQLGVVYDKLGKSDLAIENLKKAVELKPNYVLGYHNLGAAYLYANRLKPAQEALETAAKLDPTNKEVRLSLGVLYARQSRFEKAIAEVKQVAETGPGSDLANLTLCRIYLMANDRKAA